jgi:hypothetical protein
LPQPIVMKIGGLRVPVDLQKFPANHWINIQDSGTFNTFA